MDLGGGGVDRKQAEWKTTDDGEMLQVRGDDVKSIWLRHLSRNSRQS